MNTYRGHMAKRATEPGPPAHVLPSQSTWNGRLRSAGAWIIHHDGRSQHTEGADRCPVLLTQTRYS